MAGLSLGGQAGRRTDRQIDSDAWGRCGAPENRVMAYHSDQNDKMWVGSTLTVFCKGTKIHACVQKHFTQSK